MKKFDLINSLKKYRWWFIFGTIAVIIIFYPYWTTGSSLALDWRIYTILIIGGFLGELLTKPIKIYFIKNTIYFSIYQGFLWLIILAVTWVINGEMYEPSPLPKILMIPWTLYFTILIILPSNFIGSLIANISKRFIFRKNPK